MVLLLLLIYCDFISFMDLLNNTRRRTGGETIIARVINLITVIQKKCITNCLLCKQTNKQTKKQ